jgi:hypothetical protein
VPARAFHIGIATAKRFQMNPQDRELLDKQLRYLHVSPRRDGVVIVVILAMFFGGIIVGGLLTEPHKATQTASNEPIASVQNRAPATTQQ